MQSRQTGRLTCADAVVERLRSGAESEPSRRQTDRQVALTCEGVEHSPCRWGHRGGTGARLAGAGSPSPQVRPGKADFAAALPFTWTKDPDTVIAKATDPRRRKTSTASVTEH